MVVLKVLLVLVISFFVGCITAEVTYRVLNSRYDEKATDGARCVKTFLASAFMVIAGVFTLQPEWLSFIVSNPDVRESFADFASGFLKLLPFGFFFVGGVVFIFAIRLCVQYREDYM